MSANDYASIQPSRIQNSPTVIVLITSSTTVILLRTSHPVYFCRRLGVLDWQPTISKSTNIHPCTPLKNVFHQMIKV
ncbi:hypothetical protein CROQUDRAFT_153636 [Cronartium quercuum f. sp. fusiforme G11]|uniref:Uncharacterized protein n=1 Tax=Cronartium quercuum f. sp. fusiforme G11 TaxID=708437 RepID=A0A9P6NRK9_9BASI|nr:hypothetical protein CROQUDRAFT_153636 [Cronartium quercuum f. sp. fusiforme G11]